MAMTLPVSVKRTKYLDFILVRIGAKTSQWEVRSLNRPGEVLGDIRWYAQWRQYTFWPRPRTLFNSECMNDITWFLLGTMDEWRERNKRAKKLRSQGVLR